MVTTDDGETGGHPAAGGDGTALVGRIRALRVNTASSRPQLYQPITLLWAIGRALRGEPRLLPWRETEAALRALLERHGLRGERPRPDYPVLALHRAGLWTLRGHRAEVPTAHGDGKLRQWFAQNSPDGGLATPVHELMRASGEARTAVIGAITDRFFTGLDATPLLADVGLTVATVADDGGSVPGSPASPAPEDPATLAAQYQRWCALVESRESATRGQRRERLVRDPIRLAQARRAVLVRSGGRCENPGCAGQPGDRTDRGEPILEVDHVDGIASGGRDHPSRMVALCPNCHAVKTRGRSRHELRELLSAVARERHESMPGMAPVRA
ncbi:HNH endonuclease [Streptomyces sp. LP05-1]|uniref:HNH endonuclease n=1 Tax=Streptomyces pyxinae TaxID=2970734 RepID=A0ABT2CD65_9ACTN|nr:HNH endonuclease signature motif containing protein [Streptomyces sp. LP05-1]MCS0634564.1 HNH endonuclease [Streptomyces sp. LP05-1]